MIAIKILDSSSWPIGVPIEKSASIKHMLVSGKMHVNKVVDLLANTPANQELTLSNDCNMMCSEAENFQARVLRESIEISSQKLTLESLRSSCGSFLSGLKEQVKMRSLEEVKFDGGTLDTGVMIIVENVLMQSNKTLNRVEIFNASLDYVIPGSTKYTRFPNVKSVVYDIQANPKIQIDDSLCKKYPNLQHFSSNQALYLNNLKDCLNLKTIKLHVLVQPSENSFDLNLLRKNFPLLQCAFLKLVFTSCEPGTEVSSAGKKKFVLGKSELPDVLLVNLKIRSNCKLEFL